jgi:hypothetical protein
MSRARALGSEVREVHVKRLVALAGLAAVLLGVTACNGSTTGQPSPVTTPAGVTSATGPATATSAPGGGGSSLPVDDPCSLLSSADLQQLGVSSPPTKDKVGTANSCELDTADDHFGIDVRTDGGLADFTPVAGGGPVTAPDLGSHQAKEQADKNSSSCTVAIGVSDSSRVDVSATGNGDTDPCPATLAVAKLVEPKLP